jgi:hypothetical protein
VRVRIIRQPVGSIDGISLDDFMVGFVYEVSTLLGCYLLADGCGEPVAETFQARVSPVQPTRFLVPAPPATPRGPTNTAPSGLAPRRRPRGVRKS